MLTLSYSACYDPYNTVFRMLAVLGVSKGKTMFAETLQIVDFFMCFPRRLDEVKSPNSVKGMRKKCNAILRDLSKSEYEVLPQSNVLFDRMSVIQETAISTMVSKGFVKIVEETGQRIIQLDESSISSTFQAKLDEYRTNNAMLLDLVAHDFPQVPLLGTDGLKARTGLGEYDYDTV